MTNANPESRALEVYRLKKRTLTLAATVTGDDEITSTILPGFKCKVGQIRDRVLARIRDRVIPPTAADG